LRRPNAGHVAHRIPFASLAAFAMVLEPACLQRLAGIYY
jgi:hypothetical protein